MNIPYMSRGANLDLCREFVQMNSDILQQPYCHVLWKTPTSDCSPEFLLSRTYIYIGHGDEFSTTYPYEDTNTCCIRIRALATALKESGFLGAYYMSHEPMGEIHIKRLDSVNGDADIGFLVPDLPERAKEYEFWTDLKEIIKESGCKKIVLAAGSTSFLKSNYWSIPLHDWLFEWCDRNEISITLFSGFYIQYPEYLKPIVIGESENDIQNNTYPVPEHLHNAWDKFVGACSGNIDRSVEDKKTLIKPFADELGFVEGDYFNWELLEEKLMELSFAHDFKRANKFYNPKYSSIALPQGKNDPIPYFSDEDAKIFFRPMYFDGNCPLCKMDGVITKLQQTKTLGKTYPECPKCNIPIYSTATVGMLRDSKVPHAQFKGDTCSDLLAKVPDERGVYIITGADDIPAYIGSAGKIGPRAELGGRTIRKRMGDSTTPYHFDKKENLFRYMPISFNNGIESYASSIPVAKLSVYTIVPAGLIAPSAIEYYLIQCHIFRFGELPAANQKI